MIPQEFDAIVSLRPGAEFVLRGDTLEWLDSAQTEPSEAEIQTELSRLQQKQRLDMLDKQRRDYRLSLRNLHKGKVRRRTCCISIA